VLLTFSTTVMDGQAALIDRVCEAVAGLDLEAVLTLGPTIARESVRVPDNVEVVAFADHDRLMPGSAAVIGHGGLGTVLCALAHGVPQLLLPLGRDQAFNADRVERVGAGIRLPTDGPPARIRTSLRGLLTDRRFAARASLVAGRIAADEPDRTAAGHSHTPPTGGDGSRTSVAGAPCAASSYSRVGSSRTSIRTISPSAIAVAVLDSRVGEEIARPRVVDDLVHVHRDAAVGLLCEALKVDAAEMAVN
jgi:Erythromycin biosynthesis protein CIII-like, C-terminal domain